MSSKPFSTHRPVTVLQMASWAHRAGKLTAGECHEGEELIEQLRRRECDARRPVPR